LEYLQNILRGKTKAVHLDDVPQQLIDIPTWPEYSCETIFDGGFLTEQVKLDYLPTDNHKRINRKWIWGLFGAVNKDMAMKYYHDVFDKHMRSRIPVNTVKELDINEEWVDKLLEFEVAPNRYERLLISYHFYLLFFSINSKNTTIHLNFSKKPIRARKPPVSKKTMYEDFVNRNIVESNPSNVKRFKADPILEQHSVKNNSFS
jgi:hypothetical protein